MIKKLDWDSDFFKLNVGEVGYEYAESIENNSVFDLLYVFGDSDFNIQIENFENTFSEVKVNFAKKLENKEFIEPQIFSIEDLLIDTKEIYKLAFESGKNSRFLLDKKFQPDDFQRLYKSWVDNSILKKIAEDVLVCIENHKAEGLVSYTINNNHAKIGLIAVDSNSQGKGIGGKILNHLESILAKNKIEKLIIPTQLSNIQACNFYKKQGYYIEETKYIKHYWKK